MAVPKDTNPFLMTGYVSSAYFCDREAETQRLISNATNGLSTTLISLRRMGKTGLLIHVLDQLKRRKEAIGIYVDIFDTENFADLTNKLATAIYRAVPEKHPLWKKITGFIKQLRPVISYDAMSGQPEVTLDYARPKQYEASLLQLLTFLESEKKKFVIAIDEFQQITKYAEKNAEAVLRTHMQPLKYVRFIFSGSSPHLLAEMFNNAKRPFFASTQTLELSEIDAQKYASFIARQFGGGGRKISKDAIDFILEFSRRHTFYTQALCNKLYAEGIRNIQKEDAQTVAFKLLKENEAVYFQYRTMLTSNQWEMLKAIAKEGQMQQPTARAMVKKYGLGPSSVVQRSMEALLAKEMIYARASENGRYYSVYDCFLARWLEQK